MRRHPTRHEVIAFILVLVFAAWSIHVVSHQPKTANSHPDGQTLPQPVP